MANKLTKEISAMDGPLTQEGYSDQYEAGGFVINAQANGDDVELVYTPGQTHHCIIGSTGSGKTVGVINSSIISTANSKSTMIISDPKGELYRQFSPYLREKGYHIHMLDYYDPSSGIRYNQMTLINDSYEEGLPHYYSEKALESIIKLSENIRNFGEVNLENELRKMVYTEDTKDFSVPIYKVETIVDAQDENKPEHFKANPHCQELIDMRSPDDETLEEASFYVVLLEEFFHAVLEEAERLARGEGEKPPKPVVEEPDPRRRGYTPMRNVAPEPDPDNRNRNEYYINRLRETVNQATKILSQMSIQTIKSFFEQQENFYAQLLSEIPTENKQRPVYEKTHEDYVDLIKAIDENIAKRGEDHIPYDFYLRYLKELMKLEATTFKSVEERAVKNANTIAEIIVNSSNEGGKTGEKIWIETPKAYLSSTIIMTARDGLKLSQKHLGSIYLQLANLTEDLPGGKATQNMNAIDRIFQHYTPTDFAKLSQAAVKAAGDKTKSSIIVSTIPPMRVWSEPTVVNQCSGTDLDLPSIVEHPSAIFINFSGADSTSSYTFLVTLFIEQIYTVLNDICARTPKLTLPRPVYFYLDEFCNLPPVPNFPAKISLARSKGIRFNFVAQSIAQIDDVYTPDKRKTILENANMVYLLTNSKDTAQFFSDRLGKYTIEITNESTGTSSSKGQQGGSSSSTTTSTSKQGRELMTADELMKIQQGEGLYIAPRLSPFRVHWEPTYKWKLFQEDIYPNQLREVHLTRPHYEPEYFLPSDYQNFIYSYMAINYNCIFDEMFNKWWSKKIDAIIDMYKGESSSGKTDGRENERTPEEKTPIRETEIEQEDEEISLGGI